MTAPSILSAVQKIRSLLTREEKLKGLGIVGFALCTSVLEVLTASVIVILAQVLIQPESGRKYVNMMNLGTDSSDSAVVFYIALIVGMVYLIKNFVAAAEAFYQNHSIQKMNYLFKNKLLSRYAEVDYEVYLTRNSSLGLQVVSNDAEKIFSSGMIALAIILSEGLIFVCLISMVIKMHPSLAFFIFGLGAVLGLVIMKGVLPRFYCFGQSLQEANLYCSKNLIHFFHAFKEIILFGKREAFVNTYQFHSYKMSHVQAMQTSINSLPRMMIEVLFMGLFIMAIGFLCLKQQTSTEMGLLGGYFYVGIRLMPGLNRIINQLNLFKSIIPSIERVYTEYTTIGAKEHYIDIPDLQFKRAIYLKGVSFRYLNTNKDALTDIQLDVKKGECLGIMGETGSGKSTLVDIILGLLRPYEGSVLIDGKFPVNSYQWHQKIGYVSQTIYLTDDTIEANIAFGEQEVDEARLNAVVMAAQLQKFIERLPEGIKTIVGERGIRLSGGERQRIAIARALYRNPEVLIFDEATSALDNETEARLIETIHALSQNRTVIMIAHRLTTLKNCDRVMVIENGKIARVTSDRSHFFKSVLS